MKLAMALGLTLSAGAAWAQVGEPALVPRCNITGDLRSELIVFHAHVPNEGHNETHILWGGGGGGGSTVAPTNLSVPYFNEEMKRWQVVAMDDFDGNGVCDLFWQDEQKVTFTFTPVGGPMSSPLPGDTDPYEQMAPEPDFRVVGSGHFNTDDRADVLWWSPSLRILRIWISTSPVEDAVTQDVNAVARPWPWEPLGVVGLNGWASTGILWRNPDTGELRYWKMQGHELVADQPIDTGGVTLVDRTWGLAAVGDFNADGFNDLFWQLPGSRPGHGGPVAVWYMRGRSVTLESSLVPPLLVIIFPGGNASSPGIVRGPR